MRAPYCLESQAMATPSPHASAFRERIYQIIFEADCRLGRLFDVALILLILASIGVVMLESVAAIRAEHGETLRLLEWVFTGLFTIEYLLRLYSAHGARRYARSFFGIIDVLAVMPTYIAAVVPGAQALLVIRVMRILRAFRVLKLAHYVAESNVLMRALIASRRKIIVFLFAVFTLVVIVGSVMYLVEGKENGFTSIPRGVYWAIVTLTTVGYGDISPHTPLGQALASLVMVMGYGIIAVPTGIVTAELTAAAGTKRRLRNCPSCKASGHERDASFCRFCGGSLEV